MDINIETTTYFYILSTIYNQVYYTRKYNGYTKDEMLELFENYVLKEDVKIITNKK